MRNPGWAVLLSFFLVVSASFAMDAELVAESEPLKWGLGFTGLAAAVAAAYYGVRAFGGGAVGRYMKLYAVGLLVLGAASVTCFVFYVAGLGDFEELSVLIEDLLRTVALLISAAASFLIHREMSGMNRKSP